MVSKRKRRLYYVRTKLKKAGFNGLVRYKADLVVVNPGEQENYFEPIGDLLDEFSRNGGQIQLTIG